MDANAFGYTGHICPCGMDAFCAIAVHGLYNIADINFDKGLFTSCEMLFHSFQTHRNEHGMI